MNQLTDTGFADPSGARTAVRRLKLTILLGVAGTSIATILDTLYQGVDPQGDAGTTAGESGITLARSDNQGGIGGRSINRIESNHMREQELLEGVDLILQLLDRLQAGVGHGLFSVNSPAKRSQPEQAPHRLSEVAQ